MFSSSSSSLSSSLPIQRLQIVILDSFCASERAETSRLNIGDTEGEIYLAEKSKKNLRFLKICTFLFAEQKKILENALGTWVPKP